MQNAALRMENTEQGTEETQELEKMQKKKPEKRSEQGKENSYEKVLEKVQYQAVSDDGAAASVVQNDADEISEMDADRQVGRLTNLALEKGPEHALKVALKIDDLYTLDKLHDSLSHALYEDLVQKGLLKRL